MARAVARETLGAVNAVLAPRGFELVKGQGYFYFAILSGFPDDTPVPSSVMVPHFNRMSAAQWIEAAEVGER